MLLVRSPYEEDRLSRLASMCNQYHGIFRRLDLGGPSRHGLCSITAAKLNELVNNWDRPYKYWTCKDSE